MQRHRRHLTRLIGTAILPPVLGLGLMASQAVAADRFEMIELKDSDTIAYLRVDTETGSIARCAEVEGVWQCAPVKEAGSPSDMSLEARIATLEARLAALEADRHSAPDMEELEAALDMSETVMRRFFGMVSDIKQDMAE